MPELPEVETLTKQLRTVLIGKTITKITVYRAKNFVGSVTLLNQQTVESISRRAKIIIFHFQNPWPVLLVHLKMTGQLIYVGDSKKGKKAKKIVGGHPTLDWINALPSKHTRVQISFSDKSQLFFNDQRTFGWLKVVLNKKQLDQELANFSPIEPLKKSFTPAYLAQMLAKSSRPVKIVIMEQKLLAGVGNIYANDGLWLARIDPRRPANSLNKSEIKKLHDSLNTVIAAGIAHGGASESTYKQLDGMLGSYQNHFLTYKRDGQACSHCGTKLVKIQLGGRGTFFCPHCQK
ncbi:bifunctional DNA-formamidopyrimidine glycosylase/DNA-(apurinic or apyrimidinic site) lyase [Candidatus Beckwithbacteria bacterium]|nr:bifunctional DNA-formamidopyrimidine glycosylase/DNA-(apurinic or apyrimidinic site) lyase [Candidatus Beckwithbacteria bacterium]